MGCNDPRRILVSGHYSELPDSIEESDYQFNI